MKLGHSGPQGRAFILDIYFMLYIQINGVKFGFRTGLTYVAVKECANSSFYSELGIKPMTSFIFEIRNGLDLRFQIESEIRKRMQKVDPDFNQRSKLKMMKRHRRIYLQKLVSGLNLITQESLDRRI